MKKGTLYIVPTPIGNLQDITLRALTVLQDVDVIGAEDTRTSGRLLKHFEIDTPQISYHKFNEKKRTGQMIQKLLQGKDIAIISDAGTPGISDPSAVLIAEAIANEIEVDVLPGASALLPALIGSGLNADSFLFLGFLPEKKNEKQELLHNIKELGHTLIFYVSPHDLKSFAESLFTSLGERKVCIARELTKLHQEYVRTKLSELAELEITLKGEFVVVVQGKEQEQWTDEMIRQEVLCLKEQGLSNREIITALGQKQGIRPNQIKAILF